MKITKNQIIAIAWESAYIGLGLYSFMSVQSWAKNIFFGLQGLLLVTIFSVTFFVGGIWLLFSLVNVKPEKEMILSIERIISKYEETKYISIAGTILVLAIAVLYCSIGNYWIFGAIVLSEALTYSFRKIIKSFLV